jgi:hypothetical protein
MRTNSRLIDSAGRVKQRPALGQALLVSLSKDHAGLPDVVLAVSVLIFSTALALLHAGSSTSIGTTSNNVASC